MRSGGPVEGRLIFMIITPSVVFVTRGVELTSLASDGSSVVLGELANGYARVESEFVIHNKVGIALI